MATADVGTGATLTLTGTVETAWDAIEILDMSFTGASRESVETTHLSTAVNVNTGGFGSRTYIMGRLSDPGELTVECNWNPALSPPMDQDAAAIVVTMDDGSIWTTAGGMSGYEVSGIGVDALMTCTATFKLTAAIVIS